MVIEIETTPEMLSASVFSNKGLSDIKNRVLELIEASTYGDLNNKLFACFWLEAYGVECAGVIPEAPTLIEYLDFKAHIAAILDEGDLG